MRMTTRRLFGAATLLALTTSGLLGGTASATGNDTRQPGDKRAVMGDKNLEWNHPDACKTAGLAGTAVDGDPKDAKTPTLPHTADGKRSITITGGLEGYTVTGVVVKGGPAYNVYFVDAPEGIEPLGDLNWTELHAPTTSSGSPADISHWFFCVEKVTTPEEPGEENPGDNPGEENPGDNPGDTPGDTPGDNPGGDTPGDTPGDNPDDNPDESESVVPTPTESAAGTPTTTTTAPAVAAGANDDDLANTGFDGGWMLFVGLGLVAAGAAFVASPKLRGLIRR
ncbi:hypothetical protein [Saccharothrix hoggarensis]